ncbi:MAG: fumarylacetoacetate hydrolase family protein [candidate division KSB1 bacterium]|nr:fumarylacetoacetate hydrolase family protein [candidate division KSB1 bacterium]
MAKNTQQSIFCRYKKDGNTYYGKYEDNTIHQLEKAPWFGIEFTGITCELSQVKLLYPSEPAKIIGLVKAYKQAWQDKTPPKFVRWFLKPASSAASDGDEIVLPAALDKVKVECELTIIIGKPIADSDEQEAEAAIFGFTVGNDIMGSADSFVEATGDTPDYQDPSLAAALKIGDGFAPFGPFVWTNVDWLDKSLTVSIQNPETNMNAVYHGSTNDLLYSPAKIVSDLTKIVKLYPGDVIMTGTFKSFVASHKDIVSVEIEGLGRLTNYISNEREKTCE